MNKIIESSHLGLLHVGGHDAKKFLQGQLTCNLDDITPTQSSLGAHCNPQGRVISLFRLFFYQDAYYLQMPSELIPIAMKALQKYAVFFKVELNPESNLELFAQPDDWHKTQITEGIAAIYPETSDKFLPHELNLPKLNAVSFNKGCYTGQEIIARMHYRGKLKNHLCRAHLTTESILTRGQDIELGNNSHATLVDFYQIDYNQYELLVIIQGPLCLEDYASSWRNLTLL